METTSVDQKVTNPIGKTVAPLGKTGTRIGEIEIHMGNPASTISMYNQNVPNVITVIALAISFLNVGVLNIPYTRYPVMRCQLLK